MLSHTASFYQIWVVYPAIFCMTSTAFLTCSFEANVSYQPNSTDSTELVPVLGKVYSIKDVTNADALHAAILDSAEILDSLEALPVGCIRCREYIRLGRTFRLCWVPMGTR
jgi:hypothetical protein